MKRLTSIIVIALGLLAIASFKLTKDQTKQATEKTLSTASSEPSIKEVKELFKKTLQTIKQSDTIGFFNLWEKQHPLEEIKGVTLEGYPYFISGGPANDLKQDFIVLCDSWEKTIIDDIIINDVVPDKFVCPKNKNADSCAAARRDFIKSFGYEFNVSFSIKKLGYESSWGVSVRKIKGKVLYAAGCVFNPEPPPANK